jgi:hypothetical protein
VKEGGCTLNMTLPHRMLSMRDATRVAALLFVCALAAAEESDGTAQVS